MFLGASILSDEFRGFLEIIFQNDENIVQSWHIDGYAAFVAGWVIECESRDSNFMDVIYVAL